MRFRANRECPKRCDGLLPESQGQNLAFITRAVPYLARLRKVLPPRKTLSLRSDIIRSTKGPIADASKDPVPLRIPYRRALPSFHWKVLHKDSLFRQVVPFAEQRNLLIPGVTIVFEKSATPQIRQLILYFSKRKGQVDECVREFTFAEWLYKHLL